MVTLADFLYRLMSKKEHRKSNKSVNYPQDGHLVLVLFQFLVTWHLLHNAVEKQTVNRVPV